jgi:branched-chain amino acid transport system permease protein
VTNFLNYLIQGIPIGCVYALVAVGLVLGYKTSGVFNLAYGAQAFVSAVIYYELRVEAHWNLVPAAIVAIVVTGPVLGLLLDRVVYRYLRNAAPVAKLVSSLGLLVAIPAVVQIFVGQNGLQNAPGLAPGPPGSVPVYHFGQFYWDQNQIITIACTVVLAIGLTVLFRWTRLGLRMRAVVESGRMAQLYGVDAGRVSGFSWGLSGFLAALTGVLFAPLYASIEATNYFALLVIAIACCVFAKLSSIPLAFIGGLGLGAIEQIFSGYLPHNSVLFTGLRPSLPFVVLVLLLLFWPGIRRRREALDPLAGVDPPPAAPPEQTRPTWATFATRITAGGSLVALVVLALFVFNAYWLSQATDGAVYAVIFLSITVVIGLAGQISLCPAALAAIGAFTTAQLVKQTGLSVLVAMLAGAVLAAAVGAAIAIPTRRLQGIYVALATLAFALLFDNVLVPLGWVSGGPTPITVPRPVIGSIQLDAITMSGQRHFFILVMIIMGIVAGLVALLRRGTTGRFFEAVRGSERASTSIGINPDRVKITAFAISGAIAGLGGGLLSIDHLSANPDDYQYLLGLFWVVVVVTIGARNVYTTLIAGFSFMLFPALLNTIGISNQTLWTEVLFGLGVIQYALHPEGIVEASTRRTLAQVEWIRGRGKGGGEGRPVERPRAAPRPVGEMAPDAPAYPAHPAAGSAS